VTKGILHEQEAPLIWGGAVEREKRKRAMSAVTGQRSTRKSNNKTLLRTITVGGKKKENCYKKKLSGKGWGGPAYTLEGKGKSLGREEEKNHLLVRSEEKERHTISEVGTKRGINILNEQQRHVGGKR